MINMKNHINKLSLTPLYGQVSVKSVAATADQISQVAVNHYLQFKAAALVHVFTMLGLKAKATTKHNVNKH